MNSDSDSGPALPPPPRYVMLDNNGSVRPPPYRRNIPRYEPNDDDGFSCLRCICFACCFLFLLILLVAGAVVAFYFAIRPEPPRIEVHGFTVKAFRPDKDFSFHAEFVVTVCAENPNDHVEFFYGHDGFVAVLYKDGPLCSGSLPAFAQGHRNKTVFGVLLTGKSQFGSGMQEAMSENRNSGRIPLIVTVKVPVSVRTMGLTTRQVNVFVNCSMVVSSISPNQKTQILSSRYESFNIGL